MLLSSRALVQSSPSNTTTNALSSSQKRVQFEEPEKPEEFEQTSNALFSPTKPRKKARMEDDDEDEDEPVIFQVKRKTGIEEDEVIPALKAEIDVLKDQAAEGEEEPNDLRAGIRKLNDEIKELKKTIQAMSNDRTMFLSRANEVSARFTNIAVLKEVVDAQHLLNEIKVALNRGREGTYDLEGELEVNVAQYIWQLPKKSSNGRIPYKIDGKEHEDEAIIRGHNLFIVPTTGPIQGRGSDLRV
ncbi:hypothetical protein B0T24DRAFT_589419 [Lasiosphaeria ovina]|uniref:Uncharacterized protein n=1 Tax=Lasiosphaeria ovina TaxID=92902 RepID=A0AAE0NCX6_9PEZI|nr:hypothetical protein B0T24DRAFT_589419 [Lasiosphaeria ovina]